MSPESTPPEIGSPVAEAPRKRNRAQPLTRLQLALGYCISALILLVVVALGALALHGLYMEERLEARRRLERYSEGRNPIERLLLLLREPSPENLRRWALQTPDPTLKVRYYEAAARQGDYEVLWELAKLAEEGHFAADESYSALFPPGETYSDPAERKKAAKWAALGIMAQYLWSTPWSSQDPALGERVAEIRLRLARLLDVGSEVEEAIPRQRYIDYEADHMCEAAYRLARLHKNRPGRQPRPDHVMRDPKAGTDGWWSTVTFRAEQFRATDSKETAKLIAATLFEGAKRNSTSCQLLLATLYLGEAGELDWALEELGDSAAKASDTAVHWLKRAAENGESDAMLSLARLYVSGEDVRQDHTLAHMWANLAASQGEARGAELRDRLSAFMHPSERAEAERMARSWEERRRESEIDD